MKKLKTINTLVVRTALSLGVVAMLFATSCQQSGDEPNATDFSSMETDVIVQADFDEIDDIAGSAMSYADAATGGKIAASEERGLDERASCAVVTHDKEAQTITIDFGDGCTGPYGNTRSGIIFITYNGSRFVPGSTWKVELRNFYFNDRHIEGTRNVENVSESLEANPKFYITLTDGKVTWPNGTFATREVDRYRVWVRAANPLLDEIHILERSVAYGLNKNGIKYSATVLEDLIFKKVCRVSNVARIPVEGIKEIKIGEKTYTIDFGDGKCDSIITIMVGNESREVDVSNRI